MVQYRRSRTSGGTYFFTVNLRDRSSSHLVTHINHLRDAFHDTQQQQPFKIMATVVLPEHLHMVMRLPPNDCDYPKRWQAIKSRFTRMLVKNGVNIIKNNRGEYNLWQRRYWEHEIRNDCDLQRHVDYIHFNPVKHGHVERVIDWPHSSFHRYVRMGILKENWSDDYVVRDKEAFGE